MRAYAQVEPFGYDIENFRAGQISSTIAAGYGKNIPPERFYPKIGEPVAEVDTQSKEDQMRILMMAGRSEKAS